MLKIFGLFLFMNFIIAGLLFGISKRQLNQDMLKKAYLYYFLIYFVLTIFITLNPGRFYPS